MRDKIPKYLKQTLLKSMFPKLMSFLRFLDNNENNYVDCLTVDGLSLTIN